MLAIILGVSLSVALVAQGASDPMQLVRDASPYTGITIDAGRGRVEIVGGSGSVLEIRVAPERGRRAQALQHKVDGKTLRVSLPDDGRDYVWTVAVPARFSARLALNRGAILVRAIEGGVTASLDAGHGADGGIEVDVPRGALNLRAGVGHIRAATRAATHGAVDVRSGVGDARIAVDGHQIVADRRPGPGHRLRLSGAGGDTITLRVDVGRASLTIR